MALKIKIVKAGLAVTACPQCGETRVLPANVYDRDQEGILPRPGLICTRCACEWIVESGGSDEVKE